MEEIGESDRFGGQVGNKKKERKGNRREDRAPDKTSVLFSKSKQILRDYV